MIVTIDQLEDIDFSQFNVIYLAPSDLPEGRFDIWRMSLPGETGPLSIQVDGYVDAEKAKSVIDRLRSLKEPPLEAGYIAEQEWKMIELTNLSSTSA